MILLCAAISVQAVANELVKIRIQGINGKPKENLLRHLGDIPHNLLSKPAVLRSRLETALTSALQPFGYYSAEFSSTVSDSELQLTVDPGPQVKFAAPDLRVSGAASELPAVQNLLTRPPIVAGEGLHHATYEATKAQLLSSARDNGFLDASLEKARLEVNLDTQLATASLWLQSGPQYYFGDLQFNSSKINDSLLRRLQQIEPGDPYRQSDVTALTRRLQDTGYFEQVAIRSEKTPDHRIDLSAELLPASDHRFDLGLGFSTDSSVRARAGWSQPAVNRRGHSQRTELFVSEPRSHINTSYRMPGEDPLRDSFNLDVGLEQRDIKDNRVDTGTLGAHFTSVHGGWHRTYGATVNYEDYKVSARDKGQIQYLSPDIVFSRLQLDTNPDQRRGYRLNLAAEGSHPSLGADTAFLKLSSRASWLMPIGESSINLLLRGEAGAIFTGNIEKVPLTRRFFTGGDQSVRGYGFEAIAPKDDEGNLIGGKYLTVGSIELSMLVRPHWRMALFSDGGRAFTDSSERWRRSVGIGARWLTPFGSLRIDLALPIDDPDAKKFRLHFSFGSPL